jgi:hypothetical protein
VLWPLLSTWTAAISYLPGDQDRTSAWHKACQYLGLLEGGFAERVEALDSYLDTVEEVLEDWGRANGV